VPNCDDAERVVISREPGMISFQLPTHNITKLSHRRANSRSSPDRSCSPTLATPETRNQEFANFACRVAMRQLWRLGRSQIEGGQGGQQHKFGDEAAVSTAPRASSGLGLSSGPVSWSELDL
jgi:hypothetical protein